MIRVKTYLLILTLFMSVFSSFALSDSTMVITEEQWEEVSEGIDFTEDFKERDRDQKEKEEENEDVDFSGIERLNYDLSAFKYLFYFLVAGLVLFLIIKIGANWNNNPTITKGKIDIESIEEIEEKMHEIDLDELLQDAIKAKNYRIALRINFLIVIKLLSQRGEIEWAQEKTNWEYHREVKNQLIADKFRMLIVRFEPIWYGEQSLSAQDYDVMSLSYDDLKKELTPNE